MNRALLTAALIVAAGGAGAYVFFSGGRGEPTAKTGPLRVEIVIASADGAPPPGFSLRSEDGRTLPLVPSQGAGSIFATEGERGRYSVVAPPGWSVVGTNGAPLVLPFEPGLPATPVPIGRMHTLYLIPPQGMRISTFDVLREMRNGKFEPSAAEERTIGADRRAVVRFKPENWLGPLRVTALFDDQTISKTERIALPESGAPMGVQVKPGSVAPLEVRLFRPEDGKPADAVEIRVEGAWGSLLASATATTDADGIARFAALPSMVSMLEIYQGALALRPTIEPEPETLGYVLLAADWRLTGEARCIAKHRSSPTSSTPVQIPESRDGFFVQVRPDGGASYGMLDPISQKFDKAQLFLNLPIALSAKHHVYIAGSNAAGFAEFDLARGVYVVASFEPLCQVRASITAGGEHHIVRVLCRRKEGDMEVLAQGWSVLAMAPGMVDLKLPTGIYRVSVLDGDREGPSVTLTLEKPGAQAQINVAAPQ